MSINLKNHHIIVLYISIISLAFAYFVEYVMSLTVCPLCVYQRFPYLIFILLSIIGISGNYKLIKYYIINTVFAAILAGYHSGVERGIFEVSSFCKPAVTLSDDMSMDNFTQMLYSEPLGMCNKPALLIFELSMAEWNLILNIVLLVIFIKRTKD
jgi:disulfide bond formation protein DsbB